MHPPFLGNKAYTEQQNTTTTEKTENGTNRNTRNHRKSSYEWKWKICTSLHD